MAELENIDITEAHLEGIEGQAAEQLVGTVTVVDVVQRPELAARHRLFFPFMTIIDEAFRVPSPTPSHELVRIATEGLGVSPAPCTACRPEAHAEVILPLTVLRRFDKILAPTKQAVLDAHKSLKGKSENIIRPKLCEITGTQFYNLSKLDFTRLLDDPNQIAPNLNSYINASIFTQFLIQVIHYSFIFSPCFLSESMSYVTSFGVHRTFINLVVLRHYYRRRTVKVAVSITGSELPAQQLWFFSHDYSSTDATAL